METLKTIEQRIDSIKNTQKITNSMKLISTTKIQLAKDNMDNASPFTAVCLESLPYILSTFKNEAHPFVTNNPTAKTTIITIGSDRGLCGSFNTRVGNSCKDLYESLENSVVLPVGIKIKNFTKRNKLETLDTFPGPTNTPHFQDARDASIYLIDLFLKKEICNIHLLYTHFYTKLRQEIVSMKILPFEPNMNKEILSPPPHVYGNADSWLGIMMPYYLSVAIYNAMLHSALSEQASRATSMESAVSNSEELIEKLTVKYNRARQDNITQELIEIMGGVNVQLDGRD